MPIKVHLDRLMFENGNMKVSDLVKISGLNKNTLYSLYKGEVTRFDAVTLEKVCKALKCQPGDLLTYYEE